MPLSYFHPWGSARMSRVQSSGLQLDVIQPHQRKWLGNICVRVGKKSEELSRWLISFLGTWFNAVINFCSASAPELQVTWCYLKSMLDRYRDIWSLRRRSVPNGTPHRFHNFPWNLRGLDCGVFRFWINWLLSLIWFDVFTAKVGSVFLHNLESCIWLI